MPKKREKNLVDDDRPDRAWDPPQPPLTWPHGPTPRRPPPRSRYTTGAVSTPALTAAGDRAAIAGTRPPASLSRWAAMTQPAAPSVVRSATAGRLPRGCSAWKRRATGLTSTVAM